MAKIHLLSLFVGICLCFSLISAALVLPVFAQESIATQSAPKDIKLGITKVIKEGKDVQTNQITPSSWSFKESLNSNDAIKYQWENTKIGVYFEKNPALCCGFLKVFLGSEVKDENYLTTTGADEYPLKLSKFSEKLKSGPNTITLVFFDHTNKPTSNRASLAFDFASDSPKPTINVVKPSTGSAFGKDISSNIVVELENFKLTSLVDTKSPNLGRLNIYGNDTTNLLGTANSGVETPDGKFRVEIKPETLPNFEKLPDNKNTKLILQLLTAEQKEPVTETVVEVITNFGNTIDIGLSKVTIADPIKNTTSIQIKDETTIKLKIDNFEIIPKPPLTSSVQNDSKKGFLQIFVDNKPIQTTWPKPEFSLKEIGYQSIDSGEKEIRVQLVNQNYEKLSPEATDKIKIQYNSPALTANVQTSTSESQNSNWKIIIIALTVILIVGGILISITKS